MQRGRIAVFLVAAAMVLTLSAHGQTSSSPAEATPGRYQLVAANAEDFDDSGRRVTAQQLFMLDTATGKVWRHVASGPFKTPTGKPGFTPEMFVSVFVEQLDGSVPDQLQKTVDYFEKHPATPVSPR